MSEFLKCKGIIIFLFFIIGSSIIPNNNLNSDQKEGNNVKNYISIQQEV